MSLPTVDSAKGNVRLTVICDDCGHSKDTDLHALSAKGYGARTLISLRFKCTLCGSNRTDAKVGGNVASHDEMRGTVR